MRSRRPLRSSDPAAVTAVEEGRAAVEAGEVVSRDEIEASVTVSAPAPCDRSALDLVVARPAQRTIDRLPEKLAIAVLDFVLGPLLDSPHRVGKALRGELTGRFRSGRHLQGVYQIDEGAHAVRWSTSTIARTSIDLADRECPRDERVLGSSNRSRRRVPPYDQYVARAAHTGPMKEVRVPPRTRPDLLGVLVRLVGRG